MNVMEVSSLAVIHFEWIHALFAVATSPIHIQFIQLLQTINLSFFWGCIFLHLQREIILVRLISQITFLYQSCNVL